MINAETLARIRGLMDKKRCPGCVVLHPTEDVSELVREAHSVAVSLRQIARGKRTHGEPHEATALEGLAARLEWE
jgi:hypothetical protein